MSKQNKLTLSLFLLGNALQADDIVASNLAANQDAAQADINISAPAVADSASDSQGASTGVTAPDQYMPMDKINLILEMLQDMASSFNGDISVYQEVCHDLQVLMDYFNNNSAKRTKFIDTIINFFTGSQTTITQMQSNYDLLFAQHNEAMFQKDSEIHNLHATIVSMEQEAQQEQASLMDVMAQLNDNLSSLQSSYDVLSAANDIKIMELAQSVQRLSDTYDIMAQGREQFFSMIYDLTSMADVYFGSSDDNQENNSDNQDGTVSDDQSTDNSQDDGYQDSVNADDADQDAEIDDSSASN